MPGLNFKSHLVGEATSSHRKAEIKKVARSGRDVGTAGTASEDGASEPREGQCQSAEEGGRLPGKGQVVQKSQRAGSTGEEARNPEGAAALRG